MQRGTHGEPVEGGEPGDVRVRGAERGEADLLAELGKLLVREEWDVAEQLVADVGLRGVERRLGVPDVLGRVEDPESQPGEKVPRGEQPGDRAEPEPRDPMQEV